MSVATAAQRRSVTLSCTAIVFFVAGVFSATFGAIQPGSAWVTDAAYGLSIVVTLFGVVKGASLLRRDFGRRTLVRRLSPTLVDMADYLGGHPDLPKPCRVMLLLTSDNLWLDGGGKRIQLPLLATRQAERALTDAHNAPARPWLVARNSFGGRLADTVELEFRDASGAPTRLTFARFRRTGGKVWATAVAAAADALVARRPGDGAPAQQAVPLRGD